jgi:hypothetical protein
MRYFMTYTFVNKKSAKLITKTGPDAQKMYTVKTAILIIPELLGKHIFSWLNIYRGG